MSGKIHAITMPKWGIEMTEGTINEWHVRVGEAIERGAPLLEVETEKIVNAVEAPTAGVLRRVLAEKGEVRSVGELIAVASEGEASDSEVDAFIASFKGAIVSFEPDSAPTGETAAEPNPAANTEQRISPIARRLAEKLGIDIAAVKGTGRNGRISKEDVEAFAATRNARPANQAAAADTAEAGTRIVQMSSMRATIARRLSESKREIPHYRLVLDVDVSRLLLRKAAISEMTGSKITLNDMLIRGSAMALVKHPYVNAQLHGNEIRSFEHADIAVAVATDNGLITPVIRRADTKTVQQIAAESADLGTRARSARLAREEITGGSFTLSNLGMFGLTRFDAIINPPQVAILAVGAAESRVVVRDSAPAVAHMMTMTLSADHRVVDGAIGAAFLATLRQLLERPETL
ncbi:MAG: dihydrolipoamide acetyltransferase family protein [Steroidobacteraceae bacterium]